MTTGPGTGRLSTSEAARHGHEALMAALSRTPSPPESSVEISTTTIRPAGEKAYRVHNFNVVIRGTDDEEIMRRAIRHADTLDAKYSHELDDDALADQLARSVK